MPLRSVPLVTALAAALLGAGVCTAQTGRAKWTWTPAEVRRIDGLAAAAEADAEGFHLVRTERWIVRTDVSARFAAEAAVFLDLFSDAFAEMLPGKARTAVRPTLTVFAEEKAYRRIFDDGTRGYYRWRFDKGDFAELTLYTYCGSEAERRFAAFPHAILLHEGTHVLMRRCLGSRAVPAWFDEGVATWVQYRDLRRRGRDPRTGWTDSRFRKLLADTVRTRPEQIIPLDRLLNLRHADWNPDKLGPKALMHYAAAERLIDFLLSDDDGREVLRAGWTALLDGSEPPELNVRTLEPAWLRHIRDTVR